MATTGRVNRRRKHALLDRTIQKHRKVKAGPRIDPIPQSYRPLRQACVRFNNQLFGGKLPPCLATLQRKRSALGYFAGRRFKSSDGAVVTDEIALNPACFAARGAKRVLSTLAHELVHQWQHHYGKPSRSGYHNSEWAAKMAEIGLIPSHTGRPGGNKTGQRMTHFIQPGGRFDRIADALIAKGFALAYVERTTKTQRKVALKKRQSKTRYRCPCCQQNAWAKPVANLVCGDCQERLVP